jgi:hypothetical protein
MKVIVCGGRDYQDFDRISKCLDLLHKKHGITLLIEGGANGADAHGAIWATNNCIPRCTFHANWQQLGAKAGPVRNSEMIKFGKPDCVVAFPGGSGTKNMVSKARKFGAKVWELTR